MQVTENDNVVVVSVAEDQCSTIWKTIEPEVPRMRVDLPDGGIAVIVEGFEVLKDLLNPELADIRCSIIHVSLRISLKEASTSYQFATDAGH